MDMVSASFACKRTKILQDSERQLMKSHSKRAPLLGSRLMLAIAYERSTLDEQ